MAEQKTVKRPVKIMETVLRCTSVFDCYQNDHRTDVTYH